MSSQSRGQYLESLIREKTKRGQRTCEAPPEISHEKDAKKGMADKQGKDKNTPPAGKLSVMKKDGVKKFNEDRSSRK